MKVRINPDGSMEFDVDSVEDAAALVRVATGRRRGRSSRAVSKETPTAKLPLEVPLKVEDNRNNPELNTMQFKVWSYLVDNDSDNGVHIAAVARHIGIKKDNASWWCQTLVKLGYAKRVLRGYYRPLGGSNG